MPGQHRAPSTGIGIAPLHGMVGAIQITGLLQGPPLLGIQMLASAMAANQAGPLQDRQGFEPANGSIAGVPRPGILIGLNQLAVTAILAGSFYGSGS